MQPPRRLVLASTSRYRAALLAATGVAFETAAPHVDERALDHRFAELGPEGFALELALRKARSVAAREPDAPPDALVIGGDQVAVLVHTEPPVLLHQPGTPERAVAQLMEMSGTTHVLVNGLAVIDTATGREHTAVDRQEITMHAFAEGEAQAYVEEFAPLDCAGGYRLEDDAGLVRAVVGEHRSGVIGLPLPTLGRLLVAADPDGPWGTFDWWPAG